MEEETMPRPRIIPGESVQATFSLSAVEYEMVKDAAREAGQSISQWLRLTSLEKLEREENA
jgi:hypothetical protein